VYEVRRKLTGKLKVIYALGIMNLLTVLLYRFKKSKGRYDLSQSSLKFPEGQFFSESQPPTSRCLTAGSSPETPLTSTTKPWKVELRYFGHKTLPLDDNPPNWFWDPFNHKQVKNSHLPWWQIPDFDQESADIKIIWELSRFDWVMTFAQNTKLGDPTAIISLNTWLQDWCIKNKPFLGPNWKCGQEASIRVLHLAMAVIILEQQNTTSQALIDLIHLHLQRIDQTLKYALAQNNNHGSSEAAALYIGGSWLEKVGFKKGTYWKLKGRRWLENRAVKLIEEDGSFSQYSVNYHRMVLDTYSMVEIWRRNSQLMPFSDELYTRLKRATLWLYSMVDANSGDAPNIGANDGANLLPFNLNQRDFRDSVQLSSALFLNQNAYGKSGSWDLLLSIFKIPIPEKRLIKPATQLFDKGGYAVLHHLNTMAVLRYPRFNFRPSQADALHVDFWLNGENVLRDAGTYSYNVEPSWIDYFSGIASHNSIEFDGLSPMPRLSRFLFGNWLKTKWISTLCTEENIHYFEAAYISSYGAFHQRYLELTEQSLCIKDNLKNFQSKAILRWRLKPGDWRLEGQTVINELHLLSIKTTMPIKRIEIVQGWESRFYLHKSRLPVLEVEVADAGTIISEYRW
jgi:hypothetical protein